MLMELVDSTMMESEMPNSVCQNSAHLPRSSQPENTMAEGKLDKRIHPTRLGDSFRRHQYLVRWCWRVRGNKQRKKNV